MAVKADAFWDGGSGGGIRCSSSGADASQYHDPSHHNCEGNNGRSVASLLPSSNGVRGVVIPRATYLGGSRGFDPNKPRLVNIDPDIKGQSCVVDISTLTKEKVAAAFKAASENPLVADDLLLRGAQTFHNLAVSYEPVGMDNNRTQVQTRQSPLGDSTYVVPRASLGGGQLAEEEPMTQVYTPQAVISPSVSPRYNSTPKVNKPKVAVANKPQEEEAEEQINNPVFQDQTPNKPLPKTQQIRQLPVNKLQKQITTDAVAPVTKVVFELDGWGQLEATYHEVIKNDILLILVYDNRFKGGMRYFPPVSDKLMVVKIVSMNKKYNVFSTGSRFEHGDFEYCILAIDTEIN